MFLSRHIYDIQRNTASVFGNYCAAVLISVQFQGNLLIDQVQSVVYAVERRHLIAAAIVRDFTAISKKSEYRVFCHIRGSDPDCSKQGQICLS